MNKLKQEDFINRAKAKYPNYDYDKVEYINNKTKVAIKCPTHGYFYVRPDCHLNGTGCPSCGGTKKMNTEEFIKKAQFVHNNYFTYNNCIYKDSNSKVIVTCPIHGDFEVKANNHLNGANCKKCQIEKINHNINKLPVINNSTKKLTTEEFIKRAKDVHGEKYDYSKTRYIKSNEKVTITCPIHGDFKITPNHFLSGRGCAKCSKNKQLTNDEFISRLKEIHGKKFTYEKTKYKSTHEHVIVTCVKHGDFVVTPANILRGKGCPICLESKLENEIKNLLNENNIDFIEQKRFDWLEKQSLDFYLPKYKIAIECQGIQHFKSIDFFGGEESFQKQIDRDNKKRDLCFGNNIKLLYYNDIIDKKEKNFFTNKKELLNFIING